MIYLQHLHFLGDTCKNVQWVRWPFLFCFSLIAKFVFAAQRQVGETALNDKSSRSHQIIRLVYFNFESFHESFEINASRTVICTYCTFTVSRRHILRILNYYLSYPQSFWVPLSLLSNVGLHSYESFLVCRNIDGFFIYSVSNKCFRLQA